MALPVTPEQQEMCRQAIRKYLTIVTTPGEQITPEQRLQSLMWVNDVIRPALGESVKRRNPPPANP